MRIFFLKVILIVNSLYQLRIDKDFNLSLKNLQNLRAHFYQSNHFIKSFSAGVRAIHTADGKDVIVQVENSWLNLESVGRSDDELLIADVVVRKIEKGTDIWLLKNLK